ncbi:glycosyltransferase [bacterium]|nr:glycosyltransferase [bacterium]
MPTTTNPISRAIIWRVKRTKRWIKGILASVGGATYRNIRFPWPITPPWKRKKGRFISVGSGIGDEMMTVTILHRIKVLSPSIQITYVSRYPDFFKGMSFLCEVITYEKGKTDFGHFLGYDHVRTPPPRPLITMIAECAGLEIECTQMIPPILCPEDHTFTEQISDSELPTIVIQPIASKWTPVKQWPPEYWRSLIKSFTANHRVVEVGVETFLDPKEFGPNFISLACQTSVREMAAVISKADLFIGPPSGGMHIANSFHVPSVIIFGGYEEPKGYNYPRTKALYKKVPCAPCWIHESQCPIGLPCQKKIFPETVLKAASELGYQKQGPPTGGSQAPLVSVIIPIYKGEPYLAQAIQSCLDQTYKNQEIIIVDDGSPDNSIHIVRKFAGEDSRIRIIEHPVNKGIAHAFNTGFNAASGHYLTRLAQDDYFHPNALEHLIGELSESPNFDLIYCDEDRLDQDSGKITTHPRPNPPEALKDGNKLGLGVMWTARAWKATGNFNPTYETAEDYDYWERLSLEFKIMRSKADPLIVTRVHDAMNTKLQLAKQIVNSAKIQVRFSDTRSEANHIMRDAHLEAAYHTRVKGERKAAYNHVLASLKHPPFQFKTLKTIIGIIFR